MIKVIVNNNKKNITIKGHANYSDFGTDIVCASVSSTVLCTINAIYSISGNTINVDYGSGYLVIDIVKEDEVVIKLFENMIRCLKDLERQYKNNIMIKEE